MNYEASLVIACAAQSISETLYIYITNNNKRLADDMMRIYNKEGSGDILYRIIIDTIEEVENAVPNIR